ncbi:MAG: FAD-dependent oxidoreductase [Rhizobiales bacterium]|nr:FAD-dependent oxidoreductase [Hyphomicrobiales bacterium]
MAGTVHIIGGGLAGLSAAVRLVDRGAKVVVHEANAQAGGRCRSYHDPFIGMMIDNGNHLLLSGNRDALAFLHAIGGEAHMTGPAEAVFPFADLKSSARWALNLGNSRLPWWILKPDSRVPNTRVGDYLRLGRLLRAGPNETVSDRIRCEGVLYDNLVRPLLIAALNIEPKQGSAALAGAIVRETLLAGGTACRPLIARDGLSEAFVTPALAHLREKGADMRLERQLRRVVFENDRASALDFGDETIALDTNDRVISAVPPWSVRTLLPDVTVPTKFRPILNAHFKADPPPGMPPMIGVVNATVEWLFAFPGRLSVTISDAGTLTDLPREELAAKIWGEVAALAGLDGTPLPPWQIVRERRATFEATPEEDAKRPGPVTPWRNLFLAGDWTATNLPATIEGAIRSGHRAAELVTQANA